MYTDPIADFLTRLRNGAKAGHAVVEVPSSKMKAEIARILMDQGFIKDFKVDETGPQGILKVALKYDKASKRSVIRGIDRVSRPGLRNYQSSTDLPRVKNGLGIAIVSTSHGMMTDKEARTQNVGGEVVCFVY
ncbi:MAG: 30S ribosomal protein S8 [Cryomorphaceae bacterium BACL18 MAG-120924-bin36]|jgi:small subunit ribosomal protein S8|nr:MAG: 30S ribosomal protein S8 [Cryomorphaceae bacterium BACL18 MAG-120924-bin36]KRP06605.1 MAG: 30S ribosomal protein S8 [Cryomorphaceae bacterium BACL18 MAG-120507-bin74]MDP4729883.1 30S ribosomal protein S8 [Schleiferiaceae bacterium]HAG33858.1 30S ribosomal protein S8 [Cryomorphaceae bacterium]MDP4833539.1 30S ribosomal protein S8 [Schleiferiaceae bacterium]